MAEAFDPYYIWLGIPPEEQPADHYRLLGVRRFEANDEVIANAADQRVRHLRSMQTGKRQAETQKLLNEISAASGTLLNPVKRKEYDAKLKAQEAVQVTRSATIQPAPLRTLAPIPVAGAFSVSLPPKPIEARALITAPGQFPQIVPPSAHRKSSLTIWIAIGAAACVALAAALLGTVALTMMARRTATDTPLVAEKPAKNPGVPANTRGPQIGEKPPSVSFPPNLKQAEGTASSDPPVVGKSSDPAGSGNFVPRKVAVTARDAQKESGKTTARFVRIELPGKAKFLNLAEVQVYSGSENVAVKGNATQSSTGYYGYAKLANDGNTNGQYYDSKSVSCTNLEDNPWWEVDLGAEKVLDKIVVWNRTDGGMDARLQGYKVLALDASRNVIWQVSPPEYPKPSSEFAPSGINGGTSANTGRPTMAAPRSTTENPSTTTPVTTPIQNVQLGKPVDILKDVRPKLWAGAEVKQGQLFTTARPGRVSLMVFDHVLSGEYLLDATITRTGGKDGIQFAIVADGRPCTIAVDCFIDEGRGGHSGIEVINGQRLIAPNYPALHKGNVLTNDKPARMQIAVRKGNVVLQVDGKILVDWKGEAATLSRMPVTLSEAGPRLAIGTWQSTYTVESLRIYPILGSGETNLAGPENSTPGSAVTEKSSPARSKLPVPDQATLAKALEKLKETFGDLEQKGKKPEEKLKLSQEFVAVAVSEKDPAVRYVLLDLARGLATAGQDVAAAVTIAESMAQQYEIDEDQLKLETLKLAVGTMLPVSAWEAAAGLAAELATEAQEKGNWELADAASQLAMEHAGHSKNVDFRKNIKQLRDKVTAKIKLWEVVKVGEKTLQTSPDDPAANLAVGKWNCLHLGAWDKGIPQLAKGGDARLAAAAVAEKDAKLLVAADGWSMAAETLTGAEKLAAQKHALELYQQASERLMGLEQLKAAKRVSELTETLAQSESPSPATGGPVPRSKPASDALRPGLLVRIYASQPPKSPTPAVGIIHSYGDFAVRREQLAKELKYSPQRLTFAGIGYIDLDRDETITFNTRNGVCFVDGDRMLAHNPAATTNNPEQVKKLLKRGRHALQLTSFDSTASGPEFSITRNNGSSVISYSPADLEAELAKAVLFRGASTKGKFSLGNR